MSKIVLNFYACAGSHLGIPDPENPKLGSVGVPMPNTKTKLIDSETGTVVSWGERGEILVKGPQVRVRFRVKKCIVVPDPIRKPDHILLMIRSDPFQLRIGSRIISGSFGLIRIRSVMTGSRIISRSLA